VTLERIARAIIGLFLLLVALAAITLGYLHVQSGKRLDRRWAIPAEAVVVPTGAAAIAYGQHVAVLQGCDGCHGAELGGGVFMEAPGVARLFASNLTPGAGGVGARYSDADWVRAIRHAVAPDGRGLLFMPSQNYQRLNDRDLGALIAWLKQLPPVDAEFPAPTVGLFGRVMMAAGTLPLVTAERIDHTAPRPATHPIGPTVAYGAYLAGGCRGCHGETFSGGEIPGGVAMAPSRNLTPDSASGIGRWSLGDFETAMRIGQLPEGVTMDSVAMPIRISREFTDTELAALFAYFTSLPARPYGGR
jgi:cytochrome c553